MATTRDVHFPTTPSLRDFARAHGRALLIFAVSFALLIALAALSARFVERDAGPARFSGLVVEPPRELPALQLQRTDGGVWNSAETDGRVALFFFGYTNCPDVCPLTLSRARQALSQLGDDAARVDVYFITVDPERDTPERLGLYVSQFHPAITGLTGTPEQLATAMSAFGVVAQQVPTGSGAGYAVDHTATSFLVDDGAIRLLYAYDTPAGDIASDLRAILAESGRDELQRQAADGR